MTPPNGKPALLVVDDDPLITDTLAFALGTDFEVLACESRPNAVELLRQLPQAPRHARALGAFEFVAKPADPELLRKLLAKALELPSGDEVDIVGASPALAKL